MVSTEGGEAAVPNGAEAGAQSGYAAARPWRSQSWYGWYSRSWKTMPRLQRVVQLPLVAAMLLPNLTVYNAPQLAVHGHGHPAGGLVQTTGRGAVGIQVITIARKIVMTTMSLSGTAILRRHLSSGTSEA